MTDSLSDRNISNRHIRHGDRANSWIEGVIYEANAVKLRYDDPMPVESPGTGFQCKSWLAYVISLTGEPLPRQNNAGFFIERSEMVFYGKKSSALWMVMQLHHAGE